MKLKKIISFFIAAVCLLCGCQTSDPAENFYEYEEILSETGEVRGIKIIACSLETEEIRVPNNISGKKVIGIGNKKISDEKYEGAFEGCPSSVKRIIIPEGVEEIEPGTFSDSISIQNVLLPESITYIGNAAFSHCEGLTDIALTGGIKELRGGTFSGCISLETAELPEGLTYIGQQTFGGCTSLEKIVLPSTVTDIETYAFSECTNLSEISLPDGLLSIGEMAFDRCEGLTDVTVPDTVETIGRDAFNGCFNIIVHYRGMTYEYSRLYDIYTLKEDEELPEWFIPGAEVEQN